MHTQIGFIQRILTFDPNAIRQLTLERIHRDYIDKGHIDPKVSASLSLSRARALSLSL